jgi:hypothetical protein
LVWLLIHGLIPGGDDELFASGSSHGLAAAHRFVSSKSEIVAALIEE